MATAFVIPVRRAQDVTPTDEVPEVPFSVTVICEPTPSNHKDGDYTTTVDLPSGNLSIGDADDEAVPTLCPGRWEIHDSRTPAEHSERVKIHFRTLHASDESPGH